MTKGEIQLYDALFPGWREEYIDKEIKKSARKSAQELKQLVGEAFPQQEGRLAARRLIGEVLQILASEPDEFMLMKQVIKAALEIIAKNEEVKE